MTKQEQIQIYNNKQKQKKARQLYIHFRRIDRPVTDLLQSRFGLFPILDEIELKDNE
jgi:hypothetical protein